MLRLPPAVVASLLLSAFAWSGCCRKGSGSSSSGDSSPTSGTTTTTSTAEAPGPTPTAAAPGPLDAAKKKALLAVFEANKAGITKCRPLHAAMMKAQEKKDTTNMLISSQAFVGCRRGWVEGLMPKISPLGIDQSQAQEEMLTWDNAHEYGKK